MPDLQIVDSSPWTQDIFEDIEVMESVKKTEPVSRPIALLDDPIALACASYNFWRLGGYRWASIETMTPTEQDRQQAELIRSYYRARITFERLRSNTEQPISEFRRKLMGIIDGYYQITEKDLGILYRLPYFYEEDLAHDDIVARFPSMGARSFGDNSATFSLYRRVLVSRQRYETVQLWLQTDAYEAATCIAVRADNPLLPLLEGIVAQGPMTVTARWRIRHLSGYHHGHEYHSIDNIALKGE